MLTSTCFLLLLYDCLRESLNIVVITDYKVRSTLRGAVEEVLTVKRNMEENIEQGIMKT